MTKTSVYGYEMDMDEEFRVKLTELWILAGRPRNRRPADFKRLKSVRQYLQEYGWFATPGVGTWAWVVLAARYAAYVGLEPCGARERREQDAQRAAARRAHDQAEREAREGRCREAQERHDRMMADIEETQRQIREMQAARAEEAAEEFVGEDWKDAYDPETAGEEWQGAAAPSDEPRADTPEGPHDLFFTFIDLPGLRIRASVN